MGLHNYKFYSSAPKEDMNKLSTTMLENLHFRADFEESLTNTLQQIVKLMLLLHLIL